MVRAFAALPLPSRQRTRLAGYLERCAELAPGFRWVAAEGLHLTLRFAGNLDDRVAADLARRLAAIRRPPFEARLGGLGSFGERSRAGVVWLGLPGGAGAAGELAADCEAACREAGLAPETRSFRPHLTLARARPRGGAPLPDLPPPPELPAWRVDEFVLFRSVLHGGRPPEYVALQRYRLEG